MTDEADYPRAPSIDPREVAHFEALADRWWDPNGPFWPLHRLNALRVQYLRAELSAVLGREAAGEQPFSGLRVLDIGCGGGILSESMARLGARVLGIDIVPKNIEVCRLHGAASGLDLAYQVVAVEELAARQETFDLVLNMEVVEHVEDLPAFLRQCATLVRPGGLMVVATINRTWLAWLTAIIGAERVLGWLPKGTHHWRKLVKPREVETGLGPAFQVLDRVGVRVNPLNRRFSLTRSLKVNYMMVLERV